MGILKKSGSKSKKPFYKKIWFWIVAILAVSAIGGTSGGDSSDYDTPDIDSAVIEEIADSEYFADSDFEEDSSPSFTLDEEEEESDNTIIDEDEIVVEEDSEPVVPPEVIVEEDFEEVPSKPEQSSPSYSDGGSSSSSGSNGGTSIDVPSSDIAGENLVWVPVNGGERYHRKPSCSKMIDPYQIPMEEAKSRGYTACGKCY